MATPTRTGAPKSTAPKSATPRKPSVARTAAPKSKVDQASDAVTGAATSFVETVKANPVTSAAIVAGVAGAGALLWSKRGQIADQASALGEKASELGGKLAGQASELGGKMADQAADLGGKLGDQASALGEKVSETYAAATGAPAKTQQQIAEEALSLKQTGDPMVAEQSKVGSVSY